MAKNKTYSRIIFSRIQHRLGLLEWSQSDLAAALGTSPAFVCQTMRSLSIGAYKMSVDELARWSYALGISPITMLTPLPKKSEKKSKIVKKRACRTINR